MSTEKFFCYWIGQQTTPPSPQLDSMPASVYCVPLAFIHILESGELDFTFFMQTYGEEKIKAWIKTVQNNGTKVIFSIHSPMLGSMTGDVFTNFCKSVVLNVQEWGVDGLDFDVEPPPDPADILVSNITTLREQLQSVTKEPPLFTAPVYSLWHNKSLTQLGSVVDYIFFMDYSPYGDYQGTITACEGYAADIGGAADTGGWNKLAIGVNCMGPPGPKENLTPLEDVIKFCKYEPEPTKGHKAGIMLYTFGYDVPDRTDMDDCVCRGTRRPEGTWTNAILENLH